MVVESVLSKTFCDVSRKMAPGGGFAAVDRRLLSNMLAAQLTERLTIKRKALTCAGVHSSQRMTGISAMPSLRAAFNRRWPSTTSPSLRTKQGILKPNSRIDEHMRSTAASFLTWVPLVGNELVDRPDLDSLGAGVPR